MIKTGDKTGLGTRLTLVLSCEVTNMWERTELFQAALYLSHRINIELILLNAVLINVDLIKVIGCEWVMFNGSLVPAKVAGRAWERG